MKTISRRLALKFITATPFAAAIVWTPEEVEAAQSQAQAGRGPFQLKFFTRHEYATVIVLADLIIPKDERSGGASDARVPEFMDFMMVDQPARQTAMRGGLALLDHLSNARFDKSFVESGGAGQQKLLDEIAYPFTAHPDLAPAATFFSSFRDLTASGFWTSKVGVTDLQYVGNRPVAEWTGCPAEALQHLGVEYEPPWRVLFDGSSLAAWRGYNSDQVPSGWRIAGGILAKDTPVADIVSKDEFGDFELELDWRIGEAGNSGLFYRGTEEYDHIYWSAPEYQLLDDIKAADNKSRLTCAGAAYALYPSPAGHLNPVGEWNRTRIIAKGAHIEHWLNGFKLLEYELWSPDWESKVKESKFAAYPDFGRARKGHIAMQGDHAGMLAFRSIRLREIR